MQRLDREFLRIRTFENIITEEKKNKTPVDNWWMLINNYQSEQNIYNFPEKFYRFKMLYIF